MSADALAIDGVLRQASAEAVGKYEPLLAEMQKTASMPAKKKNASNWQEKIAKMRETYPNAFRPWTDDDDDRLKLEFQNNPNIDVLSQAFGRHPGSIIARLKKHFGEDVVA